VADDDRLLSLLATLRAQRRTLVEALLHNPDHRHCCATTAALLANAEATELVQELIDRRG